jgi:hypothetical protein
VRPRPVRIPLRYPYDDRVTAWQAESGSAGRALPADEDWAAAKAGDTTRFEEQDTLWTKNAEGIAELLSGANPNWVKDDVVDILGIHLKLAKDEAVARMEGKWEADIAAFDQILTEILTLSDVLAAGIVKQFPDRFEA